MKSFHTYIQEKRKDINSQIGKYYVVQWLDTAWKHILGEWGIGKRSIPLTSKLFKNIWGTPIRATVYHITNEEGAMHIIRNQNKKGVALSVMPRAPGIDSDLFSQGIWKSGVILKLNANILMAGDMDIMSVPDKGGRRWVGVQEVQKVVLPELQSSFKTTMVATHDKLRQNMSGEVSKLVKIAQADSDYYVLGAFDGIAETLSRVMKGSYAKGQYPDSPLIEVIDRLKELLRPEAQPKLNTILSKFVKTHIEETNKIMELFLGKSREAVEKLATSGDAGLDTYEELVANQYKVVAVSWQPRDPRGNDLEKLKAAAGSIPFFNLATIVANDFADLAGNRVKGITTWGLLQPMAGVKYNKFKNAQ